MSSKDNESVHNLLAGPLAILHGDVKPVAQLESVGRISYQSCPTCRSAESFALTHVVCENGGDTTSKVGTR